MEPTQTNNKFQDNPLLRRKCGCNRNKLETTDWLSNYTYIDNEAIPRIVEVRFKNTRKEFYHNPNNLRLKTGHLVIVESTSGFDIGEVSMTSDLVNLQMRKRGMNPQKATLQNVLRMPNEHDLKIYYEAKELEPETVIKAREFAIELKLNMKINDVEIQADRRKATFYYTAEGRVDFRELIRVFARNFKVKVEMRQIGIRQEAGRVGGIGDCGRELCCSAWLNDFSTVPTIAAKQQNLYLNPSKLSGQCGRLKCCLNYELDNYIEAMEAFPPENIILKSKKGPARVFKLDILKGLIWFSMGSGADNTVFPVSVRNSNKIRDLNKRGVIPDDFKEFEYQDPKAKKKSLDDEFDFNI